MTKNPHFHSINKNIDVHFHFIRNLIAKEDIVLKHYNTHKQLAHVITKSLAADKFLYLRVCLVYVTLSQRVIFKTNSKYDQVNCYCQSYILGLVGFWLVISFLVNGSNGHSVTYQFVILSLYIVVLSLISYTEKSKSLKHTIFLTFDPIFLLKVLEPITPTWYYVNTIRL